MLLKKLGNWVKDVDIFGHPVTVFYKGSDTYKTKLGLFFTLGVFVLTMSYLMIQLSAMADMSDPEVLIMTKTLLQH